MTMFTFWQWGGVGSHQHSEIITFDDWVLVAKWFFYEVRVFSHALFFPMILALFSLLKKLVVKRLVFSTKKKGQNHRKRQGMWKNTNFGEESLTMIHLDCSRWLNVGRWWKFWSKCLQWWHVKIRWWVLQILRNWWSRNIDLFP